jgi:hypothetical protein
MSDERETPGETTESTERIPPGSMPPEGSEDEAGDATDDEKADKKADEESKDSFPASDPPAW